MIIAVDTIISNFKDVDFLFIKTNKINIAIIEYPVVDNVVNRVMNRI